jgi:hypothetical protein
MSTKTKIWIGVGAAVFAGTTPLSAAPINDAQAQARPADLTAQASTPAIVVAQHRGHGGEGEGGEGEGGEGGAGAGLPPELAFAFGIAQMRGHLFIAEELLKAGNRGAALTHFQHPQQEVYGRLRGQFKQFGVAPFEAALKLLVTTVRDRKDAESYTGARKAVDDALAAAEAAVKPKQTSAAVFTLEAAIELIKLSAHEYDEAVKKGRIVNPVEYQDGRGFAATAERMIEDVAADLEKKDAAAFAKLRAGIAELKKAWPTAVPPKTPVKDYSALLSDVARIEPASGSLLKD